MPIRGSPNGANALVHTIHTPGRHRPESVDAINRNGVDVINRNGWSSSRRAPRDVRRAFARAFDSCKATVDHEGDAALLEAFAKKRTVTVAKRMIQNDGRQPIMLDEQQRVPKRVRRRHCGTGILEGLRYIHRDNGLVLDEEDCSPLKGALHCGSRWRGKARYCQRQRGLF